MIRNSILVFVITFSSILSAQSKYGFRTGIDTTAERLHLKSKKEFTITYANEEMDTLFNFTETYNEAGFITSYTMGKRNTVKFEYNPYGYLISETGLFGRSQANGWAEDTTIYTTSETTLSYGKQELVLTQSYYWKSPSENSSTVYSFQYDSLGRIISSEKISITNQDTTITIGTTFYDEQGRHLRTNFITDDGMVYCTETFYDHNNQVTERRESENGIIYRRNITVYLYY